jgi:hypothetical protein
MDILVLSIAIKNPPINRKFITINRRKNVLLSDVNYHQELYYWLYFYVILLFLTNYFIDFPSYDSTLVHHHLRQVNQLIYSFS